MGLLDKLKQKKTVTENATVDVSPEVSEETGINEQEVVETVDESVPTEVIPEETDEERRFTMLVEQAFQMEGDEGVLVVGNLYGKMKQGDRIFVLFPNAHMSVTHVGEMEVGPGRIVTVAENEKVALKISEIKRKEQVPQFTVISNIPPIPNANEGKELENPLFLGMTMEFLNRKQEPEYNSFFVYLLCHTKYVVPAGIMPVEDESGTAQQVRFPTLPDLNDASSQILPIFTDWNALSRWEGVFNEEHPEYSVVVDFWQVVNICKGNGFVINPFGPMTIVVSAENIRQIVNTDGFKREFGLEENKEAKPDQTSRTMLGVPRADNPEVKAVTDAIVAYAKQDETIKRIDLLLKSDSTQKKTFVIIVDCPKDQTARIGEGILNATAYQRKEVENMEFFLYGSAKFVNDMVSEKSVIYKK